MTTGSIISDHTAPYQTGYTPHYPPYAWVNQAVGSVGTKYTKTWSGGDAPATPKTLETVWRWLPGARRPTPYRRVVRLPRRAKFEDHPYSCSIEQWFDSPIAYTVPGPFGKDQFTTFKVEFGLGYSVKPESLWGANDEIALIGKLRERIVGSDFNAGVFLGEGHQTLGLIFNAATRIAKSKRALFRGDPLQAIAALGPDGKKIPDWVKKYQLRPHSKDAANLWLEMQYGWLPLVHDAYAGAQALAKLLEFPLVQTYKVRKRKAIQIASVNPYIAVGNDWEFAGTTRTQYIARLKEANIPSLIGLSDPASVGWELVPFSFVADWFIPIGEYLAARGLAQSVTGTFVKTITRVERFNCSALKSASPNVVFITQPQYFRSYVVMTREVSSTLSVPKPSFKPLGDVPSWRRCANAVSLLVQNFGSQARIKSRGAPSIWSRDPW